MRYARLVKLLRAVMRGAADAGRWWWRPKPGLYRWVGRLGEIVVFSALVLFGFLCVIGVARMIWPEGMEEYRLVARGVMLVLVVMVPVTVWRWTAKEKGRG